MASRIRSISPERDRSRTRTVSPKRDRSRTRSISPKRDRSSSRSHSSEEDSKRDKSRSQSPSRSRSRSRSGSQSHQRTDQEALKHFVEIRDYANVILVSKRLMAKLDQSDSKNRSRSTSPSRGRKSRARSTSRTRSESPRSKNETRVSKLLLDHITWLMNGWTRRGDKHHVLMITFKNAKPVIPSYLYDDEEISTSTATRKLGPHVTMDCHVTLVRRDMVPDTYPHKYKLEITPFITYQDSIQQRSSTHFNKKSDNISNTPSVISSLVHLIAGSVKAFDSIDVKNFSSSPGNPRLDSS